MRSQRFSSQALLVVLLVLVAFAATYLLYTRPATRASERNSFRVTALREANTVAAERLASYQSGSNELSQVNDRLAAAKRLLPTLDTGGLDPVQYMRLNIPVRVQAALEGAGMPTIDIGQFGAHVEAGMPESLIAMSFAFRFTGPLSALDTAVASLNASGTPTTVLKTSLSVAAGDGSGGCAGPAGTAGPCLSHEVTLLVWFSRPVAGVAAPTTAVTTAP